MVMSITETLRHSEKVFLLTGPQFQNVIRSEMLRMKVKIFVHICLGKGISDLMWSFYRCRNWGHLSLMCSMQACSRAEQLNACCPPGLLYSECLTIQEAFAVQGRVYRIKFSWPCRWAHLWQDLLPTGVKSRLSVQMFLSYNNFPASRKPFSSPSPER